LAHHDELLSKPAEAINDGMEEVTLVGLRVTGQEAR